MGLFSLISVFVVVVLIVLFKDGFKCFSDDVFGVEMFVFMAKVWFCGVVVDFAWMKMVDYCSFGLVSNVLYVCTYQH